MGITAPVFWSKDHLEFLAYALKPLSWLYQGGDFIKQALTHTHRVDVPVVCVGNVTLGGSGKTPVVIDIVRILMREFSKSPHILSRGYARSAPKSNAPLRVLPSHTYSDAGDEPLLLARHAPTWISSNRVSSAHFAINAGADFLVMDDGFQNNALYKNINILVVDGHQKFGNGCIFPAGPLRTSITRGMEKADLVIMLNGDDAFYKYLQRYNRPIARAFFQSTHPVPPQPVMAFAGIGYPEKFKRHLINMGYDVVRFIPFPDHHAYTHDECKSLINESGARNIPLLTTEKDIIKWCMPENCPYSVGIELMYEHENDREHIRTIIRSHIS